MTTIFDQYKQALVDGINRVMGDHYVSFETDIIDDLEQTYANEVGEDKLLELQTFYGIDNEF